MSRGDEVHGDGDYDNNSGSQGTKLNSWWERWKNKTKTKTSDIIIEKETSYSQSSSAARSAFLSLRHFRRPTRTKKTDSSGIIVSGKPGGKSRPRCRGQSAQAGERSGQGDDKAPKGRQAPLLLKRRCSG